MGKIDSSLIVQEKSSYGISFFLKMLEVAEALDKI